MNIQRFGIAALLTILLTSNCFAANQYSTRYNPWTHQQDYVLSTTDLEVGDITASGTVSGTTVIATDATIYEDLYVGGTITGGGLSSTYLKLDQTTPQTVSGGKPIFSGGIDTATITSSTGAISFDNENLSTTGTLGAGAITGTALTIDSNIVNLSDTTDEYILAFDTATQTWRGVAGSSIEADTLDTVSDRGATTNQIITVGGLILSGVTSDPITPTSGQIWFRSDLNEIRIYLGTTTYKLAYTPV